jgi:hypothetical protein
MTGWSNHYISGNRYLPDPQEDQKLFGKTVQTEDLNIMTGNHWTTLIQHRDEWKEVAEKAKTCK